MTIETYAGCGRLAGFFTMMIGIGLVLDAHALGAGMIVGGFGAGLWLWGSRAGRAEIDVRRGGV